MTLLCVLLSGLAGCVSISLDPAKTKKSERMLLPDPPDDFVRLERKQIDAAWKNKKTGSIISVISECNPALDPRLEALRNEVIGDLSDETIASEQELEFLGRAALRSSITGKLDGVETAIELLVVKKDGCHYLLTLVSVPAHIGKDRPHFERFLKGFKLK